MELSKRFPNEKYVNRALYTDLLSYLPGDLLAKEDRATMAVGLESRVPFLDHRLIEFSFRIHPDLKMKGMTSKYILKRAFEDILPKEILYREKHGFAFPIAEHLRTDLKSTAEDILLSTSHNFFNKDTLKKMLDAHMCRKSDFGQHIWALIVFNMWYEKSMK